MTSVFYALASRIQELRNDRGASAVEYGLLVALIAVIIIAGVTLLGGNLAEIFEDVAEKIGI